MGCLCLRSHICLVTKKAIFGMRFMSLKMDPCSLQPKSESESGGGVGICLMGGGLLLSRLDCCGDPSGPLGLTSNVLYPEGR